MAEPSPEQTFSADGDSDANVTPRWVKVFGIIALIVVLLFVILLLTRGPGGRGGHTPMRHFGGAAAPSGHP